MDAEKCYDTLDACNGVWKEYGNENSFSFFRPTNGLNGIAKLALEGNIYDLAYGIKAEDGVPIITLNNRSFNLTISSDGESMQLERLGKVNGYSLLQYLPEKLIN